MPGTQYQLLFESFGAVAELACDDPALFAALPDVLPPDWRAAAGKPLARFELRRDGTVALDGVEFVHTAVGRSDPLLRLGSVVRHHLALLAPEHAFIHAGVVGVGERAIVLPGKSHSGKTTLVAELVRAGAMYYSDEYAVVDAAGAIHAYPKPLSVRTPGSDRLGVPVAVPSVRTAAEPIRAGVIVLSSYQEDAVWRPVPLSRGEGASALLANTVAARPRTRQALAAAAALSRDALVLSGARGEAAAVAGPLIEAAMKLPAPARV